MLEPENNSQGSQEEVAQDTPAEEELSDGDLLQV